MTRTTCASLLPATNPVAASRRICPKPASGGQRHWESFNHKKGKTKMKKNKKMLIGIGVAVILSLVVFCVFKSHQSVGDGTVLRLGAILPLTDAYSDMGGWIKNGIELAIEDEKQMNPAFQITLTIEDCAGKAGVAITQYRKLMNMSRVNCILSTLSPVCMSLKPIAVKDGVLMVGFLGQDEFLHEGGDRLFRYAWTANNEVTFLTSKILESIPFTASSRTAFVHMDNDIGRNFNQHYKNNIPGLFREFVFSEKDEKIKSIAASVIAWNPDCLITLLEIMLSIQIVTYPTVKQ